LKLYWPGPTSLSGTRWMPRPGNSASPSSPGRITINGTIILKAAPMIGAIFAERRSRAARTRCTTRKSVVQYPNEITQPKPNTIPTQ
jgi:hypothetical protein